MEKLHVGFAALKTIRKFIDDSGLDNFIIESGIYGQATIEQIKSGKHMKRSIELYFTLYTALFQLHLEKVLEMNPEIEKDTILATMNFPWCHHQFFLVMVICIYQLINPLFYMKLKKTLRLFLTIL